MCLLWLVVSPLGLVLSGVIDLYFIFPKKISRDLIAFSGTKPNQQSGQMAIFPEPLGLSNHVFYPTPR